jgi:cold shock CspA family protein
MAEGRIRWYSHQLGHGFIVCEDPFGEAFLCSEDITGRDPWSLPTGDRNGVKAEPRR